MPLLCQVGNVENVASDHGFEFLLRLSGIFVLAGKTEVDAVGNVKAGLVADKASRKMPFCDHGVT